MRKQYLLWIIAVFGIVGVPYGGYLLIYHFNHDNGLSIPALLLLVFGGAALITFIVLYILSYISIQKKKVMEATKKEETATATLVVGRNHTVLTISNALTVN